MPGTVAFVDPRARRASVAEPYDLRWDGSRGSTPEIGILVNNFFDSNAFADVLADALKQRAPGVGVRVWSKLDPSTPAPVELVDEVAAETDVCISLIGHCGSCTSGTVRDAINLARRGTPSVALVTEMFDEHAAFIATAAAMPGIPLVILPHPVAGTGTSNFRAVAQAAAAPILAALGADVAVAA
jgi:hypothetical protein